jgi:hypothetical protein
MLIKLNNMDYKNNNYTSNKFLFELGLFNNKLNFLIKVIIISSIITSSLII